MHRINYKYLAQLNAISLDVRVAFFQDKHSPHTFVIVGTINLILTRKKPKG